MLIKFGEFLYKKRSLEICMLIFFIIAILIMSTFGFGFVKQRFVYPEEEYQALENEAQRIIDEKTLSIKFNPSVQYVEYILHGEGTTSVTISVSNDNENTQATSVYRENDTISYYIGTFATFALVVFIFSFVCGIIVHTLLGVIGFVCIKFGCMLRKYKLN